MTRVTIAASLIVLSAFRGAAQSTEPLARSDAADVAAYIASQTGAATIPSPRPGQSIDAQAQAYVDRLSALASSLETQLRGGADRAETRETYRQMRRVRLELITYAMNEGIELPATESLLFEQMLGELSRYHRGE